jgi:chromosome segregation ATPase
LNKKISDIDQEKNDIENKLIQEKLKHHQTQSDLLKIRETFEQTQKDLNEEIESRKDDLRKIDELKKQFLESDKKSKEYKKSIKRLSQQIVDLQNKINADNKEREKEREKELHTDVSLPELTTHDRLETEPMPSIDVSCNVS